MEIWELIHQKSNSRTYELLKSKLLDYPNVEFNQYVLDLAKYFSIDVGSIEKQVCCNFDSPEGIKPNFILKMDNCEETVYLYLENKNHNVKATLQMSHKRKAKYLLREITFDKENDIIIVVNSNFGATEKETWIFKNNILIYRSLEKYVRNFISGNITLTDKEILRIDEYYDAFKEKQSPDQFSYFSAVCVYYTFSNFIKGENLNITEKEISQREILDFINNWTEWLKTKNVQNVEKYTK